MTAFVPGLALSRDYYTSVVASLVERALPGVPYTAALIGDGSEVQGFDTPRSADHDWGPRVQLFYGPEQIGKAEQILSPLLANRLPDQFGGHSTQYHRGDLSEPSGPWRWGEIIRGVEIHEPGHWARTYLGIDPRDDLATADWLALPWTLLRGAVGGAVWRDDEGAIASIRKALEWYPMDLWRYLVACQWQRINQEEPFVGRAAEVNAEVGSRLAAARQMREVMHLCFLLKRQHPPYSKWLETAFAQLDGAEDILTMMLSATSATTFADREAALGGIYESVATIHNDSRISPHVAPQLQRFHDRPFRVLNSHRFVEASRGAIDDVRLRQRPLQGCISQYVDSTDILASGAIARQFRDIF